MAVLTYEQLVTELAQKIKANGNREITGSVLNLYLQGLLDSGTLKHVVADTAARNSITTKYVGMRVFVISDDKTYTLKADGTSWGETIEDAFTQAEVTALVANKVDKIAGKGLSTNDFTNPLKAKLDSIEADATANDTDANLRDRTTHTGEQPTSTITGLDTIIAGILDDILNIELGSTTFAIREMVITTDEIYACNSDDHTIVSINNTATNRIVVLPDTTESEGRIIVVKKGDNAGDLLTVYPNDYTASISNSDSPQLIEGEVSFNIPFFGDSFTFQEKEGDWYVISAYHASSVDSVNGKTGVVTLDTGDIPAVADKNYMTDAEQSKLGGIEANADVTDTANVDAAGATMNTDSSLTGNSYFLDEDNMASDDATKVASQQSIKKYVDDSIAGAISSEMSYKGGYNAATNTPDLDTSPSGVKIGDMYTVTVAGTFFTTAVDAGDVLIAEQDNADIESSWTIVEKNLVGALLGANNLSDVDSASIAFDNIKQSATTTKEGVVERATQTEVHAGTDDTRYITPKKLNDEKGIADGLASLNGSGLLPTAQLPLLKRSQVRQDSANWVGNGQRCRVGASWIDFAVEDFDTDTFHDNTVYVSGTATGTHSTTTLQDTSKSWTVDEWAGYTVKITGGTNADEVVKILSNTANTLTVDTTWITTVDNTSTYEITLRGRFLVPETGLYLVSPRLTYSASLGRILGTYIYKNNTFFNSAFGVGISVESTVTYPPEYMELTAGDYIEIKGYQGGAGAHPLLAFGNRVRCTIIKIGN